MKTNLLIVGIMLMSFSVWAADDEKEEPLAFDATYTGDYVNNMSGGLKRGSTYLGFATVGMGFDFEKAGLWRGGVFYVNGGNTHGGEPSSEFIGDMHIVDNIEAGDHSFLQELWYEQTLGKWALKVGLQDLNADFAMCSYSSDYLHSTLGINSVYAGNVVVPIFPLTGLGLEAKWNVTERFHWQAAVFDGGVIDFEENPYNVKWKLSDSKGYIATTEFHYLSENEGPEYKLGAYYHTGDDKYGVYAMAGRSVWQSGKRKLDAFAQVAFAPKYNNDMYLQLIGGVNLHNAFCKDDMLGLAATSSLLNEAHLHHETVIELTYKCPLMSQLYIQPDMQYVISPAGVGEKLDNALVAIVRMGFEF